MTTQEGEGQNELTETGASFGNREELQLLLGERGYEQNEWGLSVVQTTRRARLIQQIAQAAVNPRVKVFLRAIPKLVSC